MSLMRIEYYSDEEIILFLQDIKEINKNISDTLIKINKYHPTRRLFVKIHIHQGWFTKEKKYTYDLYHELGLGIECQHIGCGSGEEKQVLGYLYGYLNGLISYINGEENSEFEKTIKRDLIKHAIGKPLKDVNA